MIQREEFLAWQRSLGSAAQTESTQMIGRDGPVPETIHPEFSDPMEARLLSGLIEPLSTGLVVKANINYDVGISLEELLAYEGKHFEKADSDGNGAISMGEARRPEDRFPDAVRGLPPGRPREPIPETP